MCKPILTISADAIRKSEYEYDIPQNENVGFVFPVYFYTVPTIIGDFVSRLKLNGAKYVYAVITCGGGICQAGAVLKKMLGRQGIRLDYVTDLLMPDNSMLFYQIPPVSEGEERLRVADEQLKEIKTQIQNKKKMTIGNSAIVSNLIGAGYKFCNKTVKFYADSRCISCGLCERICPQDVIKINEGKPQWTKATCSKCSACINRCPKQAIQYGKKTEKRNRYVNPEL